MTTQNDTQFRSFLAALNQLHTGYQTGLFDGHTYGASVDRPIGGRIVKLFAEEYGGPNAVSFNLYCLSNGRCELKPCEMSSEKVTGFVLGFTPDH